MAIRLDILAEARTWVGVPFRWGGRSRHGIDCGSLVFAVAHASGCPGYGKMPVYRPSTLPSTIRSLMRTYFDPLPSPRTAELADVLVLTDGRHPIHLALVSGRDPLTVIHASVLRKTVVEGPPRELTPITAWRVRGVGR